MPGLASQTNSRSRNLGGNFGKKHTLKDLHFFNRVTSYFFLTSVCYFVGYDSSFFVIKIFKDSFHGHSRLRVNYLIIIIIYFYFMY